MTTNPWDEGEQPNGGRFNSPGDLLKNLVRKLTGNVKLGGGSRRNNGYIAVLAVLAGVGAWLLTGIYVVQPDEKGLEMRFGRWVDTTEPGLQYHLPWPIGQALKPQVTRIRRINIGFSSGLNRRGTSEIVSDVPEEALMLTGDENIVDVQFSVFWLIRDPGKFLFQFDRPEATIKAVAESVMREIIAQNRIQNILTEGRKAIEISAQETVQNVLDSYNVGVMVTEIKLQRVDPPREVIAAFRDVQAAAADQVRMRNEAEGKANDMIPRARGEAREIVLAAEAFKQRKIKEAEGQKERYLVLLEQYLRYPELTKKRMYLEAIEEVLSPLNKIVVDTTGTTVVPYLQSHTSAERLTPESRQQQMIPVNSLMNLINQQSAKPSGN